MNSEKLIACEQCKHIRESYRFRDKEYHCLASLTGDSEFQFLTGKHISGYYLCSSINTEVHCEKFVKR